MAKIINIIGQKFGKLTVINMCSNRGSSNQIMYDCKCDCGNNHTLSGESIRSGKSKSCGVLLFNQKLYFNEIRLYICSKFY